MNTYLDKIHAALAEILATNLTMNFDRFEELCESPIEVALGLSLYMLDRIEPVYIGNPLVLEVQEKAADWPAEQRMLIPQYKLDGKRIDFLLKDPPVQVFIECDGHDFHERTKEQAKRDRSRDRQIQRTGTPILRFTGSEIYAHPTGCANEVFVAISDLHINLSLNSK